MAALPLGERGYTFLHQAQQCYLLAQCTIPTLAAPFGDIVRLLLSSQNNQMTIYQEFAMHSQAKSCLDLLSQLLAVIPTYYLATTTTTTTTTTSAPDELLLSSQQQLQLQQQRVVDHEILLNIMVLIRNDSAPAA